ncbi:MAG TPA: hypothetical protein VHQ98_10605 [Gaiellaceae bacterium]|nr:hypothetical protein [Gaiellaceae bacterium]
MATRLWLFPLVWILVVGAAAASSSHGGATTVKTPRFHVMGHVDPRGGYNGDVFGERQYAYLSSRKGKGNDCPSQGVRVYDLANPRKPRHISTFGSGRVEVGLRDTWTEKTIVRRVKTEGFDGVLAVTSAQACGNGFGGFGLYDVTRPAHPKRLALVRTEPRGSHEIWLAAARGHAWVYTAEAAAEFSVEPDSFGFHIFDVSNPRTPFEVGGWSACKELHLCTPVSHGTEQQAAYLVHSVITNVAATRAYLSYWDLGTVFLDISDPARPRYLGRTDPGQGKVHSAWLAGGGKIMLETHELEHGRPVVWQIADPAHPVKLATVHLPAALQPGGSSGGIGLSDSVHDPKILGRYAYFSWYGQGVPVFDLKNPRKPRFVTRFLPPPKRDAHGLVCPGGACTAVWGVFPMQKYVLASDMSSGLWVLSRPV